MLTHHKRCIGIRRTSTYNARSNQPTNQPDQPVETCPTVLQPHLCLQHVAVPLVASLPSAAHCGLLSYACYCGPSYNAVICSINLRFVNMHIVASRHSELTGGVRGTLDSFRLATDDLCYSGKIEAPKDAGCRSTQIMRIRSRRRSACG